MFSFSPVNQIHFSYPPSLRALDAFGGRTQDPRNYTHSVTQPYNYHITSILIMKSSDVQ